MLKRTLVLDLPKRQSLFLWGARKTGKSTYLKDKFPNKTFIDPAKYLESSNLFKEKLSTPKYIFKTSGNNEKFNSMIQNHLKLDKYKLNSTIYNNVEPILDNVS